MIVELGIQCWRVDSEGELGRSSSWLYMNLSCKFAFWWVTFLDRQLTWEDPNTEMKAALNPNIV